MLDKALKNLKSLSALNSGVLKVLRSRSEVIARVAQTEKEKLIDRLLTAILKDRDLGAHPEAVRSEVRTRLFEHVAGDPLFVQNIKYMNSVVTSALPKNLQDVPQLKDTIIEKIIQDAKEHAGRGDSSAAAGQRGGSGRKPGQGGGRSGRGGRHQGRNERSSDAEDRQGGAPHRDGAQAHSQTQGGRRGGRENLRSGSSAQQDRGPRDSGRRDHNRPHSGSRADQGHENTDPSGSAESGSAPNQ
jgi:hypothetical protein